MRTWIDNKIKYQTIKHLLSYDCEKIIESQFMASLRPILETEFKNQLQKAPISQLGYSDQKQIPGVVSVLRECIDRGIIQISYSSGSLFFEVILKEDLLDIYEILSF